MAEEHVKKQVKIVMWGTPRTMSTAVYRAMWNRKSCKCIPEPYGMAFFFSKERVLNWYPDVPEVEEFGFKSIKKNTYETSYEEDEVFVKDFPTYLYRQKIYEPKELFPDGFVHAFLLRAPKDTIASGYRVFQKKVVPGWTEWDDEVVGFKQLWEMYNEVKKIQPDPLIFHSDDLVNHPEATLRLFCERTGLKFEESMMHWSDNDLFKERMEQTFPILLPFTETVMSTSGFNVAAASRARTEVELPPELQKCVEDNNVYYEKLMQFATRIQPVPQPQ